MTAQELQLILEERFQPDWLDIKDDSAKHIGHRTNQGGGHYRIVIVSSHFRDQDLITRHRMIYEAVGMGRNQDIHALSIQAKSPEEWQSHGSRS